MLDDGRITDSKGRTVDCKNCIIIMTSNIGSHIFAEWREKHNPDTAKDIEIVDALDPIEEKEQFAKDFANKLKGGKKTRGDQSSLIKASYSRKGEEVAKPEGLSGELSTLPPALQSQLMQNLQHFFRPEFLNRLDDIIVFSSITHHMLDAIIRIQLSQFAHLVQREKNIHLSFDDNIYELLRQTGRDPAFGARPLKRAIQRQVIDSFALYVLEHDITEESSITGRVDNGKVVFE